MLQQAGSAFTKKPRLFEVAPSSFVLRVGYQVGVAVYRTFDIAHQDAGVGSSVNLEMVYGPKEQPCIYTGKVTEISGNAKTFCHDINTFAGCSGAVVFLLLLDVPPDDVSDISGELYGKAVGVNVGGLDANNNIGFILKSS